MPQTILHKKQHLASATMTHRVLGITRHDAFKKAHRAVTTLRTIKPLLTPQDEETLTLMMDTDLMETLENSLAESKMHKLEPLERILP